MCTGVHTEGSTASELGTSLRVQRFTERREDSTLMETRMHVVWEEGRRAWRESWHVVVLPARGAESAGLLPGEG